MVRAGSRRPGPSSIRSPSPLMDVIPTVEPSVFSIFIHMDCTCSMPVDDPLPLLYGDDRLVAVAKPSGLPVHRGWSRERIVALTLARDRIGRHVYPVHRLDRATSGVLLFALDPEAARRLQEQFEAGAVRKRYLALVRGITPAEGVIDHPLPREEDGPRVPAVTGYR